MILNEDCVHHGISYVYHNENGIDRLINRFFTYTSDYSIYQQIVTKFSLCFNKSLCKNIIDYEYFGCIYQHTNEMFGIYQELINKLEIERPYLFQNLCILFRIGLINCEELKKLCLYANVCVRDKTLLGSIYPDVFNMEILKQMELTGNNRKTIVLLLKLNYA
jgi:hypothetical protein